MKKLMFVFNPHSGKAKIRLELLAIIDQMNKAGYEVTVWVSQYPGQCSELVRDHGAGFDRIVCSGGDGTLNEVINGLMQLDTRPELGYIPAGSTNDVASGLGIPSDMKAAAEVSVQGSPCEIDIGRFGTRYFNYVAAFGAFTEVTYKTPQDIKNMLGHQAYILNAVNYLADIHPITVCVGTEESETEVEVLYGMITNAKSVGGFTTLVGDDVDLADGEFELLFIRNPKNPLELPQIVAELALGQLDNPAHFYRVRGSRFHIHTGEETGWVLDGEYGGTVSDVDITCCPKALRILVPAETAGKPEEQEDTGI